MIAESTPHVGPRAVLKWALLLYKQGIKQAAGVTIDIVPGASALGPDYRFLLSVNTGSQATTVLFAHGAPTLDGPLQVVLFAPGLWCADLYRAAVMACDDTEED